MAELAAGCRKWRNLRRVLESGDGHDWRTNSGPERGFAQGQRLLVLDYILQLIHQDPVPPEVDQWIQRAATVHKSG